jgi:polyhydroxyalkanoate synthesis repressor PhaR
VSVGETVIVIKKYPNRRLYDTSRSTYVNLDGLATLVRAGHEIEVVDARSGDDLTKEVLMQVVLEVLRGEDFFPPGMLRRIIRATGDTAPQRALRQQMVIGMELMSTQLDRMEALFGRAAAPPKPPPSAPEPPPGPQVDPEDDDAADAELAAMRERLAALESRLKRR